MSRLGLRICALVLLAIGCGSAAATTCTPNAACFSIGSLNADDAGGIYIGSIVTLTVVVKRTDNIVGISGQWQAELVTPPEFTYVDNSPPSCTGYFYTASALVWPSGTDTNGAGDDLAPGASFTCQVRLRLNSIPQSPIAMVNTYQGSFIHGDGGIQNDTRNYTFNITAAPTTDMAIALASSASSVLVGGSVDYTLTASNIGRQTGTNVQAVFNFPTTLSVVPKNCPGASTTGGQAITWTIGNMNYATSQTCVLTATAQSGAGSNATVTADISASTTDPNTSNNSASKTIAIVAPQADLSAAISAIPNPAAKGNQVTFTLKASNAGPQSAASTQLTGTFPAQLQLNSASCASGTPSNPLVWNIGTLAAGANTSCSVVATVIDDSVSSVNIKNNVSSTTNDPNTANNVANYTLQITPAAANADLAATITASASSLMPGQSVTFTLKASNLGPQSAASTQLTGQFPSQLQLNSASCMSGTPTNPLLWSIGTLAASASQTCTVQATLKASTTATSITASDSVSSATADSNSGNNSASVVIAVKQQTHAANLAIHLAGVPSGQTYTPGEVLRFTVTATNTSIGSDASGVIATVHLPNDGSLTGFSATCGTVDATGKLVWSIGVLPRNSSLTCSVSATVVTSTHAIPVSADIDASVLGNDLDHLMDALVVPVNSKPKQISVTLTGAPTTKNSTHVALSGDGSVAVFESQETALAANNANANGQDIYRVAGGTIVRENMDSSGHQLIGTASLPAVSGDGSIVAFTYSTAAAKQAKDVVTSNMWAGPSGQPKHPVDTGMSGAAPNAPSSGAPSVSSASGSKKLVFCSAASNLVAGDTNGGRDIFLVDPLNPAQPAQRISTDSHGNQLPGDSCEPKISADGTKVVFTISATSLYGTAARQVFRKDLATGKLEAISVSISAAAFGNADSTEPTISADGSVVAFTSQATNLDSLGTPVGGQEAFVSLAQSGVDGSARTLKRVRSGDGTIPNGSSQHPQLSNDGTIVVMQTAATNFFGSAKQQAATTTACGTVVITTNFFNPAALGSSLCNGQTSNQNPTISGDGTMTGFDSNTPQPGTQSSNSNAYTQGIAGLNSLAVSNFGNDFSGQWYDPNQSGQGLVIDVTHPDANNNRVMILTWFVYLNGQPTWMQGSGVPRAGSGAQAGMVVVQLSQVGIYQGHSFPLGEAQASASLWGSITLTFADANNATMNWTSTYPGFNSGTMAISHFLPVGLPANDAPGAQIKACYSGNWYNPAQSGHGFEFEVIPTTPPLLAVDWFAYGPTGAPVWLSGVGPISGNSAQVTLALIDGSGAQFPPRFDATQITKHPWGTATFTFTDSGHAQVTWNSTIAGYGSGQQPLQPTLGVGLLDRRTCQ